MREETKQKIVTDWKYIMAAILLLAGTINIKAQEPPPRPIRINSTAQILSFGAFYHGASGGTVTIEPSGVRSSTGSVVLLNMGYTYSAAMFEIQAHRGTVVSILNGPDVMLTGIPSGSMSLHIGNTNPTSPFVSNVNFNVKIPLYVGGTLTVGNSAANPPGTYTGSFLMTIVRE
jgi:hypothetical protein